MKRYVFNPKADAPLRYVHPVQAKSVANLLSNPFPDYIDRIILFGGSLDLACGMDSDLDLYVISEHNPDIVYKEMYDRCKELGKPFDILVSPYEDFIAESMELGTAEYEIAREGLCLYAKA
jgi:predicted nucleotidyltransferase